MSNRAGVGVRRITCQQAFGFCYQGDNRPQEQKLPEVNIEIGNAGNAQARVGIGFRWCREQESNLQGTKYRRILSPLRLPVPPSRHFVEVRDPEAIYYLSAATISKQQM